MNNMIKQKMNKVNKIKARVMVRDIMRVKHIRQCGAARGAQARGTLDRDIAALT